MKIYLRHQIFSFAALLFVGSIFITGTASASSNETLIITGTGASVGTMELMAKAFQKKHTGVNVQVLPSIGSTGGIKAVNKDKIDIGLSYRPLKHKGIVKDFIEFIFSQEGQKLLSDNGHVTLQRITRK